jgi:hypothetical protein
VEIARRHLEQQYADAGAVMTPISLPHLYSRPDFPSDASEWKVGAQPTNEGDTSRSLNCIDLVVSKVL